jgi:hypothetical protein
MFRSSLVSLVLAGLALMSVPREGDAQVSLQVGFYWEFGDDGWRSYGPTYDPRPARVYTARPREIVYYTPRRAVRVPPGHMPPPGYCRLWYPGTPPGHQPRPRPCEELFRYNRHDGAVIIGRPEFAVDRWEDRPRCRGRGKKCR